MKIHAYVLRALLPALFVCIICTGGFFYLYPAYDSAQPGLKTLAAIAGVGAIASLLYLLVRGYLFLEHIRKTLQTLTDDSLSIAAGDYKITKELDGPQEVKDLETAMQTMSECLQENMARLRESSALRERMHGEYECAVLLQHYMFHNVLDEYKNPRLSIRPVTYRSTTVPHGVFLKSKPHQISLSEAVNKGFEGMYDLLLHQHDCPKQVLLDFNDTFTLMKFSAVDMPAPIVWSTRHDKMLPITNGMASIEKDDLIFLYNEGFAKCFDDPNHVQKWFHKVLRHFASEGVELFITMLNCEVNFLTKKLHIDHDINILCIQIT